MIKIQSVEIVKEETMFEWCIVDRQLRVHLTDGSILAATLVEEDPMKFANRLSMLAHQIRQRILEIGP